MKEADYRIKPDFTEAVRLNGSDLSGAIMNGGDFGAPI